MTVEDLFKTPIRHQIGRVQAVTDFLRPNGNERRPLPSPCT